MGMYTEFIFGCELSKDLPKVCIDALDKSINDKYDEETGRYIKKPKYETPQKYEEKKFNENYIERTTPDEEIDKFIEDYDFGRLFHSCSYYFGAANSYSKFHYDAISESYHISTRSDLKNYTNQVERFIEYIKPYVIHGSGYDNKIFAYVQYEEAPFPTIYGTTGVYHVDDPNITKKYDNRIDRLHNMLEKLYLELAPEYQITQKELDKRNIAPNAYTYDDILECEVDYICKKYKNAAKKYAKQHKG
jgi:hypothetical protein